MSKGSGRRPARIPYNEYLQNWERTFSRYTGVDQATGWQYYDEVAQISEFQKQALLQVDEELEPTRRAVQQQMDEEKKRGCNQ